jgi:beta-galactosidase
MKLLYFLLIILAWVVRAGAAVDAAHGARQIISLDANWKFHLGDEPAARSRGYDDQSWRRVDVPHDYVIESAFDPKVPVGVSAHWYVNHACLPLGPAWYRKSLSIPSSFRGRRIWLEFDGVFSNSQYWLNGRDIGSEHSGYTSFRFDITDALLYGVDNVLSVRVDPHYDGWWYEGGGIYRHVRLVVLDPVHIAPWGIFASASVPEPGDGNHANATVSVKTELANQTAAAVTATLLSEVLDPTGKVVVAEQTVQQLPAQGDGKVQQQLSLPRAALWSFDHPTLYGLRSTVSISGETVDQVTTAFGVRQIRFDPDHGFFLNGKHVEIQGVNCHQDHAGVGVAMPDRLIEWRLERLKEMGCNAIRLSHNPVAPVMLEDCDRMGILVIAENRHLGDTYADQTPKSTPALEHRDLTSLVMRDRNHPCIILWSLCNEQWTQGSPEGAAMARAMKKRVEELDGTRPVTAAMNGGWDEAQGFTSVLDVVGFNYHPDAYLRFHLLFPDKPMIATEIASEEATRGIYELKHWSNYRGNRSRGYFAAYSINAGPGGQTAENAWPPVVENAFIAGGFVWSGFDYKGEPQPFVWPNIGSQYGLMDDCGFPKDSYYYYKSWWTDQPVLHIFPHWNWPGREGQEIPVWVQTNCQKVELFLNGVSQGSQDVQKYHHVEWNVKYAPGTLTARGIRDGKPIESTIETTGAPAAIRLVADRTLLEANTTDLAVVTVEIVDSQGRIVPVANGKVSFAVSGPGKLVGVGNGDPTSHDPDKASWRFAFNGLAQAIVQTCGEAGQITLTAQATGLRSAEIQLNAR